MTSISADDTFATEWNALARSDRLRLRRLVRLGRPVDAQIAHLAPAYAEFQMRRPWMRYFWLWFVPAIALALGAAASVHPILVGVVIALGGQAVFAYFNLRKIARNTP